MTLWALATLGAQPGRAVLDACAAAMGRDLGAFSLRTLANACWGLALLGALPPGLWEAAVAHAERRLDALQGPGAPSPAPACVLPAAVLEGEHQLLVVPALCLGCSSAGAALAVL